MTKAEKFIKEYTKDCSNMIAGFTDDNGTEDVSYREWLTPEQALRATEIAQEELRKKMIEIINHYYAKGHKNYNNSLKEGEHTNATYWDGFQDACSRLGIELEELI